MDRSERAVVLPCAFRAIPLSRWLIVFEGIIFYSFYFVFLIFFVTQGFPASLTISMVSGFPARVRDPLT